MIRKFLKKDLQPVMSIWLNSNIDAHPFISADYWKSNFDSVQEMIPRSDVFVFEKNGAVNGFIGIVNGYIAGIFINKSERGKGIGTELINTAKKFNNRLCLSVYEQNTAAIKFYKKSGFRIESVGLDSDTAQKEYAMVWEK